MSKINFGDDSKIIGVDTGAHSYTLPQHVTSVNGKTREEFENFGNADDIEEIIMTSDEPVADEEVQAPVEVAETLNETLESPVEEPTPGVKRKSGRKVRRIEGLHANVEMIAKKHAIHEPKILEITFKSMLEKALLELMVREILTAYDVHEDSAPALLVYMWNKAPMLEGRKTYLDTLQQTAEGAEIGYSNVQKITKKLLEKGLLVKESYGLGFSTLLEDFFASLTENKQILLTFEQLQEEQMEAITKDSKVNEEMANQ